MAGRSTISFSYTGIGEMLRSPEMEKEMLRRAEKVKAEAERSAPVGDPRRDTHSGRYKASFHIDTTRRGGVRSDRAAAYISNDSPEAVFVEFGTSRQVGRHILRNALNAARD
jgi:HK97 gp10 family phage protein